MGKKAIILNFLIVIYVPAFSQKSNEPDNRLKEKNYWGISVIPLSVAKMKIYGDKAPYQLNSHSQFGLEALFNYYHNFEKNYSLVFSAGVNALGSRLHYTIPKEMFDPPTVSDVTPIRFASQASGTFNLKVQAELLRQWSAGKTNILYLTGGMSLLYSSVTGGETSETHLSASGQTEIHLTRLHNTYNNGKPWFNFHISGGYGWTLKSKKILQASLKANYSPTNFFTGTYRFNVGNQPELSGQYKVSGSYIGLCITYIFAGAKED